MYHELRSKNPIPIQYIRICLGHSDRHEYRAPRRMNIQGDELHCDECGKRIVKPRCFAESFAFCNDNCSVEFFASRHVFEEEDEPMRTLQQREDNHIYGFHQRPALL